MLEFIQLIGPPYILGNQLWRSILIFLLNKNTNEATNSVNTDQTMVVYRMLNWKGGAEIENK